MSGARITAERMRELVHCDIETGLLRWIAARKCVKAGAPTGLCRNGSGYPVVSLDGRQYYVHRLIWLAAHGEWPKQMIDHINLVRHDNRITNLREVSRSVNAQNQRNATALNKSSGLLGAHLHKHTGLFHASIELDGRAIYLGRYKTATEAHEKYLEAKRRLHPGNML